MKTATLSLIIVIALAVPVLAAPGDPRLIQGILEWPQSLDKYPVLLIRGDDGTLYYANIGSAERRGSPSAGTRVAVLGVEGKHANEVLAMFVTTSTVADPTPSVAPAASAGAATTAPAQSPSAGPPPAPGVDVARTTPSGLAASSAAPAVPAQPGPQPTASRQPATTSSAPAQLAPSHAAPPQAAPPQAAPPQPVPPQNAALPAAPAQPATPQTGPVTPASPQISPATGAAVVEPLRNASPLTEASPQATEVQGTVLALGFRTVVLKADDGQRIVVDVSALGPAVAGSAVIGSRVKVYGVPIEQRFKAAGFIETVGRPR